jgi:tetratricopeptide (TPR) repeat protein
MEDAEAGPVIHPLLAEYARALAISDKSILTDLAGALVAFASQANEGGLPARFIPFRPHVEVAAPAAEETGIEQAGLLWNELGSHLETLADYTGARAAFERALAVDEVAFGLDHPRVARDVNNLGIVLQNLGDLAGARAAFGRTLAIDEQALGPDHPEVATDVSNLGGVLHDVGDLVGARAACERALTIDEAAFSPDHPRIARDVNNIGILLHNLGDLAGARAAFERALAIDEAAFGPDHPRVARDINNLARAVRSGRFSRRPRRLRARSSHR